VPLQPSLDGNTVNARVVEAAFAKNAVQYEASLTFLNDRIHRIMQALKGN
jgi:flagellar basal-body rod protein FlgB